MRKNQHETNVITPAVTIKNNQSVTTSLNVAKVFGKQHAHVLRAIQKLEIPDEFRQSNFGLSSYINEQGKKQPQYDITRDGFTILVMGFTGKEAMKFKLAYIKAFNRMEEALKKQVKSRHQISARKQLEHNASAVRYPLDPEIIEKLSCIPPEKLYGVKTILNILMKGEDFRWYPITKHKCSFCGHRE